MRPLPTPQLIDRMQRNIDALMALGEVTPDIGEGSLATTLVNASELGRAAVLILSPPIALGRCAVFEPQELIGAHFDAPSGIDLSTYEGRIAVARNTSVARGVINFSMTLTNKKAAATTAIMTMAVPRTLKDAQRFQDLPPSPRPNQELFMRSMTGTTYLMRGPDDRQAFDIGLQYAAPLFGTVLERMLDSNA